MSLTYPVRPNKQIKGQYHRFYGSLGTVLPCQKCRDGFKKFVQSNPVDKCLRSRTELINWLVKIYNSKRPPNKRLRCFNDLSKLIRGDTTTRAVLKEVQRSRLVF